MFGTKRRDTLTGVAHTIAMRFGEVSEPYINRGQETPREILAHEFGKICEEFEYQYGGKPLTTSEMELLANRLVPKAIDKITRRISASLR